MKSRQLSRRQLGQLGIGAVAFGAITACSRDSTAVAEPILSQVIEYGSEPMQQGNLRSRVGVSGQPVVVLIHGGYWKAGWHRSVMGPLAEDLSRRGWATWNIDYRRVGDRGGGWPGTLEDVATSVDLLESLAPQAGLDPERVAVLGHSAGAQLALWAAGRAELPDTVPGGHPRVTPAAAVSLSGVLDLVSATNPETGADEELIESTLAFVGGPPDQVPERYSVASPISLVALGLPQLLIHGMGDVKVPISQTTDYARAAELAGDEVAIHELEDVDHFDVIKKQYVWWAEVLQWLPQALGSPP